MAVSSIVSYERAKAESLGLYAKGGLMERAERIVLLCIGLLFDALLIPVLWLMLVLTLDHGGAAVLQGLAPGGVAPVVIERQAARRSRRQSRRSARTGALQRPAPPPPAGLSS